MNDPLVSVILPSYNHAKYVIATLDSVLEQDYSNLEFLIVDDGSTDDSVNVITDWIKTKGVGMKISFRSRPNKGISATLNELLEMSKGEFIAGASSDDTFLPGSFSKRMKYLLNHPEKLAVFGNFNVLDKNGAILAEDGITSRFGGVTSEFSNDHSMRRSFLRKFCVAGPVVLLRKSAFNEVGLFDEKFVIEDWDLYLRLSARGVLGYLDQAVAGYRVHDGNSHFHRKKSLESVRYERRVLEKNRHLYSGEDLVYVEALIRRRKKKEISHVLEGFFKRTLERLGLRRKKD